jgi:hypothetical protein
MTYYTGASCTANILGSNPFATASLTIRGVAAAQQRATDFHQLSITAATGTAAFRLLATSFHTLADKTIALGAALPSPTVTALTANYKRLQAVVTLPAEYQASMTLSYSASTKSATVVASFGWLGSANATLAFPDFAGVAGWLDTYAPPSGTAANWNVGATGTNITSAGGICTEGAFFKSAFAAGTL